MATALGDETFGYVFQVLEGQRILWSKRDIGRAGPECTYDKGSSLLGQVGPVHNSSRPQTATCFDAGVPSELRALGHLGNAARIPNTHAVGIFHGSWHRSFLSLGG